jgi:hypothetical protein
VYQSDADDLLEFIGEDEIPHTAKKQPLILTLGKAFDIVCESMETDRYEEENLEFVEYHYYLNNQKEETVIIKVDHSIHDRGWEMVETSHVYEKTNSTEVLFNVEVKPDEVATVSFKYVIDRTIYIKNKN